jgi:hypothetical protein
LTFIAAFWIEDPPRAGLHQCAFHIYAPELELKEDIDHKIDIRSFACLVFDMVFGRYLCDSEAEIDSVLAFMSAVVGSLPHTRQRFWLYCISNPETLIYELAKDGESNEDVANRWGVYGNEARSLDIVQPTGVSQISVGGMYGGEVRSLDIEPSTEVSQLSIVLRRSLRLRPREEARSRSYLEEAVLLDRDGG